VKGFTVIIPVYNEEELIVDNTEKLMNFLNSLKIPYEIIIGDNGSTDSTFKKGKNLMEKYQDKVEIFHLQEKGSVGAVFKKSVLKSRYDKIISIDMDLSVDLNFITICLDLLNDNSIVIGSKITGSQERPLLRKLASYIYIKMVKILLGLEYHDYSPTSKGYKKSDIIGEFEYLDKGTFYTVALSYLIKRKGHNIKEIPVSCFDIRKSKFNLSKEIFYRFKNLMIFFIRINLNNL